MLYKAIPQETKVDMDERIIEGYASTFGNVDLIRDVVEKGAFKKTLKERFPKNLIKFRINHAWPIGIPTEIQEDSTGLLTVSRVSKTPTGDEALVLAADGVMDRMSIGYDVVRDTWDRVNDIRHLKELKLYEYSMTDLAVNELAIINGVKALADIGVAAGGLAGEDMVTLKQAISILVSMQHPEEEKRVVSFQNFGLADRALAWDATAAEKRIRSWAEADDEPNAKYRRAFVWYDAENDETFGGYKLLIADIVGGEIKAVPRGIFAAAGVVQGARGGVDIPDSDRPGVRSHLGRYYAKMRREFDDDTIVAPWEGESSSLDLGAELADIELRVKALRELAAPPEGTRLDQEPPLSGIESDIHSITSSMKEMIA